MIIRRHTYDEGIITAQCRDGNYLWIAYKNASSCKLKKVSIFNPQWLSFDITVNVTEITRMKISGNYLYCAVEDDTYIGIRYKTSDPMGSYNFITIPSGVNEKSIDVAIHSNGTDWFLITPGEASGEISKIIKISETTYDETIALTGITNVSSMTIRPTDDTLWAVTYDSPAQLIKIYEESGGTYSFTAYDISG